MAAATHVPLDQLDEQTYRRRIRAWTLYDWANSAFVTTVMAAVLPVYYSSVAGATLPSRAVATSYWSLGLAVSLFIAAIMSPILGTISDIARGKKRFLAIFTGVGIVATALLVLVERGDWVLASLLAIFGRVGLNGAISFYDSLLPHVARPADQDSVSARGYAMGYLGGGILLAINVAMIQLLPGTLGARLSFLSVALWWLVFSIPLFRQVPEPPAAAAKSKEQSVVAASFKQLWKTIKDIRHYGELFKFLIAFLIYNDAIGTIISLATIYGAELGFGTIELILALLLVQFVGIPYSLIFGRLPSQEAPRRPLYLAYILFNLVALPLVGIFGARVLPGTLAGAASAPYISTENAVGEGRYLAGDAAFALSGTWSQEIIPAAQLDASQDATYSITSEPGAEFSLRFNGQQVELIYAVGPDHGTWSVLMDGQPLLDDGEPVQIDAYNETHRFGETQILRAEVPGEHLVTLVNTGERNTESSGTVMSIGEVHVLPPIRVSSLPAIIGILLAVQAVGALFAFLFGRTLFTGLANSLNTKRSILLALVIYAVIAAWGFFLDSTIEYWLLAWMVAIVQGGSQALSRSLYAAMSPATKSGEFFGLFGVMEKFSAILGPLLFALAGSLFGSSRIAILSLILFFIIGGFLLTRVNVEEGKRRAKEEDAAAAVPA
ncbi:MAG TPA: MFS transporter [Aggregatilineales bacterium]|nr:MFS transporter [Aggregatilineales bacterium]